ncbi:MAG: type effector Hrp-dependent outer [Schumannella sp.]|nr:type effector Hrp-dependent outer [Schumannella sp.]
MIGTIADDVTGATDVAAALHRHGLRTILRFGVPESADPQDADAVVVALKSRTVPAEEAIRLSRAAAVWLGEHGADRLYFKYCSTFDSTPAGNIGPVLDALADLVSAPLVINTPSSPRHGRTQYLGHLFVGDQLLSESSMRHHPLTPMTDSSLVRLLSAQTSRRVDLLPHHIVRKGSAAIADALSRAREFGVRYALVDAVDAQDLAHVADAVSEDVLIGGAAGLADAIAKVASPTGGRGPGTAGAVHAEPPSGEAAVLAGSCSARTVEQIACMQGHGRPSFRLDVRMLPDADALAATALRWFDSLPAHHGAPVIYSSMPPSELQDVHRTIGVSRSSEILELAIALIATGLIARGVVRLITAGGETSGAIIAALGVTRGVVGDEAAPGVPWIHLDGGREVRLLLKSGNFGDADLLLRVSESEPAR